MLTETETQGGTEMNAGRASKPLRPSGSTVAGWVVLLFATCMTFVYATVATDDLLRIGIITCGIISSIVLITLIARWFVKRAHSEADSSY